MFKRSVLSLAVVTALTASLTGCGSSSSSSSSDKPSYITSGTLTVCSDVPYPPFEDFDKSAPVGFVGFDVDIVSAIAQKLGVKVVIKDSDFNALKSGLAIKTKQCDLIASAMTITPERQKVMAFSTGYFDADQSLLVPANSGITNLAGMSGKTLGVQDGTTGQTYANAHATGAKITVFPDDGAEYAALKAGQVQGLLQDLPVNVGHQNDPKQAGKWKVVETYKTNEQYGLAMSQDNKGLVSAVNAALATMKSDGSYQKIYDKYFKVG